MDPETQNQISALQGEIAKLTEGRTAIAATLTAAQAEIDRLKPVATEAESAKARLAESAKVIEALRDGLALTHRHYLLNGIPETAQAFAPAIKVGDDLAPTKESLEAVAEFRKLVAAPANQPTMPNIPRPGGNSFAAEDAKWRKMEADARTDIRVRNEWLKPETQKQYMAHVKQRIKEK